MTRTSRNTHLRTIHLKALVAAIGMAAASTAISDANTREVLRRVEGLTGAHRDGQLGLQ